MLSTAIIIFRETLEIAMILGVVLAATQELRHRTRWIVMGLLAGGCGAGLIALFAESISASLEGVGQEIFNAAVLFAAATMIGCTVLWMRGHARAMGKHLKDVGQEVTAGKMPLYSLALITGLAMLREGSEIVLFVYSMLLSGQNHFSIIFGCITGLLAGVIVGTLMYYGLLKIPARHALKVTSWLLILLVAGLAAQGANFLSAAGYFSHFTNVLWDSSAYLSEDGILGKTLHTLVGYSARPTSIQLIFYIGTLAALVATMSVIDHAHRIVPVVATAVLLLCLMIPSNAHALDEIYSPIVTKGEFEIEYNGSRTFDNHSDKNNVQGQEIDFEYGVTDRWKAMISGSFEKNPGESLKMDATQLESIFQLTEQGEYWVDAGLLAAYGFAAQSHQPDFVESKLLLQKDTGRFTHLANIGFEQNVGHYSGGTGGPEYSVLWSSRYRMNEYVQPGFEIQSTLGHGPTLGKYNEQEHYIGPAVYGRLLGNLKYEAAYLFGASDAAAQGAARILLEYEIVF